MRVGADPRVPDEQVGRSDGALLPPRTPAFAIRPGLSPEELRDEGVTELRWWTLGELEAATDVEFAPRRLPSLLRELLRDGPPAEPVDVGV